MKLRDEPEYRQEQGPIHGWFDTDRAIGMKKVASRFGVNVTFSRQRIDRRISFNGHYRNVLQTEVTIERTGGDMTAFHRAARAASRHERRHQKKS